MYTLLSYLEINTDNSFTVDGSNDEIMVIGTLVGVLINNETRKNISYNFQLRKGKTAFSKIFVLMSRSAVMFVHLMVHLFCIPVLAWVTKLFLPLIKR